jgi:hypothetical protein
MNEDWRKVWDMQHGATPEQQSVPMLPTPNDAYKAMETALLLLLGEVQSLRTELLVIKVLLVEKTNE